MTRMALVTTSALLACTLACATAARKREEALGRQLDELVYDKPLDEVWQEVRLLLAQRDFPLVGEDAKAVGQKTSWVEKILSPARETTTDEYDPGLLQKLAGERRPGSKDMQWLDTGWNYYGERYHVEGRRLPDGCRVTFVKIKREMTNRTESKARDHDIELDLARRVAPEAAARIDAAAQEAAK